MAPPADEAVELMKLAVRQSGRQEFVTSCLFRLWPDSKGLLREVSRRLGAEIRFPEDRLSLLGRSIRTGYEHFKNVHRRKQGRYRLEEWDFNVFFGFFYGLYWQASEVGCCRVVCEDGGVWTVLGAPYLTWRERHPGPVKIYWDGSTNQSLNRIAWRLAWQTMLAYRRRRHWIERRLLRYLGSLADVEV